MDVDSDDRPALNVAGLLARYTNGTWRTECLQSTIRDNDTLTARIGDQVCGYLGFRYARARETVEALDKQVDAIASLSIATNCEMNCSDIASRRNNLSSD